ncbi:ATP-binding protein [Desulfogranum japonicum]|uniref:ATP-binding protein n=1 Tax=Desulfogranum japonicum TaxID=231447 RepID=UPI00048B0FB8|nr:ATP-binding protein [Desulfogranum japonicum]
MKISIQYKLFAIMLLAILSVVAFMTLVFQWSFDRGFLDYVNVEEQAEIVLLEKQLENYYNTHQTWAELKGNPLLVFAMWAEVMPNGKGKHRLMEIVAKGRMPDSHHSDNERRDDHPRYPIQRTVILDEAGEIVFGRITEGKLPALRALEYQGKEVGRIGIYPPQKLMEVNQLLFVQKQQEVIVLTCLAAILITIVLSLVLAWHWTKPIRLLSVAVQKLALGDYSTRVNNRSGDELERLSHDVNTLAKTLEENEQQRQQWVSDIAHELRTPLTGLKGEIEGLQDGIRKPGPQTYTNLYNGVTRLERLVNDLYDLTRGDMGNFAMMNKQLDLCALVESSLAAHQFEADLAGLELSCKRPDTSLYILGDGQRIQQLMSNLLINSIRYTDSGGKVIVTLAGVERSAVLTLDDSKPGVPDQALSRLFDRLYRVEQSRNRSFGGSGLGLAISRQIVMAHNGQIHASVSPLGGLQICVRFPLLDEAVSCPIKF